MFDVKTIGGYLEKAKKTQELDMTGAQRKEVMAKFNTFIIFIVFDCW